MGFSLRAVGFGALLCTTLAAAPAVASAADFRVCADPDYMPFSNRAGQGFENEVARFMARSLGDKLVYVWESQRSTGGFDHFLRLTLEAKRCDVVMDVPYASENLGVTKPYYVSSYVFVFPKSKHYDITSLDSPILQRLRLGYEEETPVETGLKLRALTPHSKPFDIGGDEGASPAQMLDAVQSGKIAVALTWEPAIGYYVRNRPQLEVIAVPNSRSQGSPEQYMFPMAMGVRAGDDATRARLDSVIAAHGPELKAILNKYGVRLYQPTDATSP